VPLVVIMYLATISGGQAAAVRLQRCLRRLREPGCCRELRVGSGQLHLLGSQLCLRGGGLLPACTVCASSGAACICSAMICCSKCLRLRLQLHDLRTWRGGRARARTARRESVWHRPVPTYRIAQPGRQRHKRAEVRPDGNQWAGVAFMSGSAASAHGRHEHLAYRGVTTRYVGAERVHATAQARLVGEIWMVPQKELRVQELARFE